MRDDQINRLTELSRLFIRLGFTAFGGPAAHIAMLEKEVVANRKWFTQEQFLDLVGATNLIPGPNSTELTMHVGRERAGWPGLVIAGMCFIVPAVLITGIFAWFYQRYGHLPEVNQFIYGIKASIIVLIFSLAISLGRKAIKNTRLAIFMALTAVFALAGVNEIYLLFGAGFMGMLLYMAGKPPSGKINSLFPLIALQVSLSRPDDWKILLIFLKVGAILYGSGYVLFSFLDAELFSKGYISRQMLVDAIAVGQFTPGPVFSSATFIGWQMGGLSGALLATAGIFLPSFLFVALLGPLIPRLRRSPLMSAFLDTVNAVSVALIAVICIEMGREILIDWRSILIAALASLVIYMYPKLNSVWLIIGSSLLGWLLMQFS